MTGKGELHHMVVRMLIALPELEIRKVRPNLLPYPERTAGNCMIV